MQEVFRLILTSVATCISIGIHSTARCYCRGSSGLLSFAVSTNLKDKHGGVLRRFYEPRAIGHPPHDKSGLEKGGGGVPISHRSKFGDIVKASVRKIGNR